MPHFDVFISYNWDVKPAVKQLYQELTSKHNLKVWLDEYELGQSRLADELASAIDNSSVFLCCITKKYSESENCKDELDYAKNLKKQIIVLMFERINMEELGGVGFIIGPKVRFNCYKNPEMFKSWSGHEMFNSILGSIKEAIGQQFAQKATGREKVIRKNMYNLTVNLFYSFMQKDTLSSGESLKEDEMLVATSKNYFVVVQKDGNLVLYKSTNFIRENPLWSSNTWHSQNPKPFKLTLQNNGNLILMDKNNAPVWTSNSENKGQAGNYKLIIQNDGNLVLYDKVMTAIWATNTCKN